MQDVYAEYNTGLIPVSPGRKVMTNLLFTSGILLFIYTILFYRILWTFSLLFFVWGYYYRRNSKFEYEYILLNNELHIDKVIANLKRKKAYRANLEYMELFTNSPKVLHEYEASQKNPVRKKRFNNPLQKTYALVLKTDSGLVCLYLNGNEEFIQSVARLHRAQTRFIQQDSDNVTKQSA